MTMQRSIPPLALLMTSIGGIIGSGWLFGPLYAAQFAGPAAILSWVLGGLLMLCVALTFAELSTLLPITGGMVRFAQFSHGTLVSFTLGWIAWLAAIVVAPIETLAILQYASNYIPGIMIAVGNAHVLTAMGLFSAAALLFLLTLLNIVGTNFISKTNVLIVSLKIIIPTLTIIILFSAAFHHVNFHYSQGFLPMGWHGVVAALPSAGVIFSFIGFSPAIQLAGEAKNPQRAIPLALIGSLSFCIILYVLLQITFIGALTPSMLSNGWQHLHFTGDAGPFAGILLSLGLVGFVYLLYADAIISPFGTGLIYTTATARLNYGMSKNGYMPKSFQKINSRGVPVKALWINFAIGLLLFLPFPTWQKMVGFLVSCFVLVYAVGPISLLTLRYTNPDITRPFKLPFAHGFALLAFYACNLIIFWTGWATVSKILLLIIIGYGYLYFFRRCDRGSKFNLNTKAALWLLPYLIGIGLLSYLSTFGGGIGELSFGWDFIIIAIFTITIFFLAVFSGIKMQHTLDHRLDDPSN